MMLDLQPRLADLIRAAVREELGAEPPAVGFSYPPRAELGDLALAAPFDLARVLRRPPREIAAALAARLAAAPGLRRAEVAGGGYVNLFLDRGQLFRDLHRRLVEARPAPARPGRVIVEHTSINPNKSAHIGHLRNATLGDTFVRALRFRGHDVVVQNYIDDTGVQVADVVVGFRQLEGQGLAEVRAIAAKFDDHCWDLYARVGAFYAESPDHRALQSGTLHEIESGGGEAAELAAHVAARIVDCHLLTMEALGIRYDLLAHESDILRRHFWERAFELLKQSGAIRLEQAGKNAGCWVLGMGAEEGEHGAPGPAEDDKIIVRSSGTVTYTGKDIAYQLWKLGRLDRDFRYARHRTYPDGHVLWTTRTDAGEAGAPVFGHARAVYNVIDVGQSYPQRVVKAGVAALGHPEAAEASFHLAYEKVVLSPATARALGYEVEGDGAVKVSGRKGLGVKADDLLRALVEAARSEIASRDPERDAELAKGNARDIAVGALRYFLLKYGRNKVITFDMAEALAFTGETGPYLQNAVVRARNIGAKLEAEGHDVPGLIARAGGLDLDAFLSGEEGDEAWGLLMSMARSDEVVEQAVRTQEVALLAKHAFTVAQAFHSYYQKPRHSVLRAEDEDRRACRVLLVDAFLRQMAVLCDLLGIPIPERM
jgi:arginyl-tRNA synthetase